MHISQSVISKIDKKDLIKSLFFLNKIKYKKSVTIEYINNNGGDSLNKKDFS